MKNQYKLKLISLLVGIVLLSSCSKQKENTLLPTDKSLQESSFSPENDLFEKTDSTEDTTPTEKQILQFTEDSQIYQKRAIQFNHRIYLVSDKALYQLDKDGNTTLLLSCNDAVGRKIKDAVYWAILTLDNQIEIVKIETDNQIHKIGIIPDGKPIQAIDFYQDILYIKFRLGNVAGYRIENDLSLIPLEENELPLYQEENQRTKQKLAASDDSDRYRSIPYHILDAGYSLENYQKEFLARIKISDQVIREEELFTRENGKETILLNFYDEARIYQNTIIYYSEIEERQLSIYDINRNENHEFYTFKNGIFHMLFIDSDILYGIYKSTDGDYFSGIHLKEQDFYQYFEITEELPSVMTVSENTLYYVKNNIGVAKYLEKLRE